MAYADFEFYSTTYGGTAIAQSAFTRLINQASAVIDNLTFDRVAEVIEEDYDDETIEKIQLATCAVAEQIQTNEAGGNLQSERVGSYSVTYAETQTAKLSDDAKCVRAARIYLLNTGLMYRGFNSGEYGGSIED